MVKGRGGWIKPISGSQRRQVDPNGQIEEKEARPGGVNAIEIAEEMGFHLTEEGLRRIEGWCLIEKPD